MMRLAKTKEIGVSKTGGGPSHCPHSKHPHHEKYFLISRHVKTNTHRTGEYLFFSPMLINYNLCFFMPEAPVFNFDESSCSNTKDLNISQ